MSSRTFLLAGLMLITAPLLAQPTDPAPNHVDAQGLKQGRWVRKWAGSDKVRFIGQFNDDKPVGTFMYYATTGELESRIDHYPGGQAAHARHYHPNGRLMAEGRYLGQEKDSTWNYYDAQGRLRSTEQWKAGTMDGEMTTYYADGTVAERRMFSNGPKDGLVEQFYPNGQLRYRANYVDGTPDGQEVFYFANGNKEIQGRWVNGFRDGGWTYYNENGSSRIQVLYSQGRKVKDKYENGTFTEYWESELPKRVITYKNGRREGPFTEWYDDGKWVEEPMKLGPKGHEQVEMERKAVGQTKKREGTYKNDVLHGPVKEYDERGRLIATTIYEHGEVLNGKTTERP